MNTPATIAESAKYVIERLGSKDSDGNIIHEVALIGNNGCLLARIVRDTVREVTLSNVDGVLHVVYKREKASSSVRCARTVLMIKAEIIGMITVNTADPKFDND